MDIRHLAAREWTRRVEAEYRSAALTSHLAHWLIEVGVSHDLIRLAFEVSADELSHAELASAVVAELGVGAPRATLDRTSLSYVRTWEPLELDVTACCLETFCLGETIAVPLFLKMRDTTTQTSARRALDRIVADEVKHRDFGWLTLAALFSGPQGDLCRELVQHILPEVVARVWSSYGALADEVELADGLREWGLMPGREYAQVLVETSTRELRPRLLELGFEVGAFDLFKVS